MKTERASAQPPCAWIYPASQRQALQQAAAAHDVAAIDRITDDLARQGLCRPRHSTSMDAQWAARRTLLRELDRIQQGAQP